MPDFKKTEVDIHDFYRWFRKKVRPQLIKKLGKHITPEAENALDNVIPQNMYEGIIRAETMPRVSGMRKTYTVISRLLQVLELNNATFLLPFLCPVIEVGVRHVYQVYFERRADQFGYEAALEGFFGFGLDSGKTQEEKDEEKAEKKKADDEAKAA